MSNRAPQLNENDRKLLNAIAPRKTRIQDQRTAALRSMILEHEKHLLELDRDRERTEAALVTIRKQLDTETGAK